MTDKTTLAVYAKKARDYADMSDVQNAKDPFLKEFIEAIPKNGRVLDLGCGPGASAGQMAAAGLHVDAFDPVEQMVQMAQQHPGVSARLASFDDVHGADIYDGIWANFSLLHASREQMPHHLKAIAKALKPGGRFHIALKTGTGSHRDKLGRYYTYYTESELKSLLEIESFTILNQTEGRGKGLSGEEASWIALAAKRG